MQWSCCNESAASARWRMWVACLWIWTSHVYVTKFVFSVVGRWWLIVICPLDVNARCLIRGIVAACNVSFESLHRLWENLRIFSQRSETASSSCFTSRSEFFQSSGQMQSCPSVAQSLTINHMVCWRTRQGFLLHWRVKRKVTCKRDRRQKICASTTADPSTSTTMEVGVGRKVLGVPLSPLDLTFDILLLTF